MSEQPHCPKCGTQLLPDASAGLCPKCLVQAGLESETGPHPRPAATVSNAAFSGFEPPPVESLAGKFPQLEILELLGKGGMGAVYKARQRGLDRLVAVKVLPPEIGHDAAFAERFTREARALARLSHNHIVSVFDFGQSDGLFYIVMEYVDGVNLRQTIQTGKLTPAAALAIVPQICEALQFAHDEGIVHRDIKPENILIDKRGRVKIADFGLAKLMASGGRESPDASLTATHQVMGTLRYMAPEQMLGTREVDHRADIYSLGVIFYELLTGELPMGKFAPPSKKVQIDVRLDEIVLRALEQHPEQRYQHASEVKTDVETITREKSPQPQAAMATFRGGAVELKSQIMPRDTMDWMLGLALIPLVFGICLAFPAVATFLALTLLGVAVSTAAPIGMVVGTAIFITLFVVLGLGSVRGATVDDGGLTIHRYMGPSKFLAWCDIVRVQALTRGEVFRQVWLWPGLPPRGSIIGMSARDYFRIDGREGCWYFCPQDQCAFLEAVRFRHGGMQGAEISPPSESDTPTGHSMLLVGTTIASLLIALGGIASAMFSWGEIYNSVARTTHSAAGIGWWQGMLSAGLFAAVVLLLVCTFLLKPIPLWRPLLALLAGAGVVFAVSSFLLEMKSGSLMVQPLLDAASWGMEVDGRRPITINESRVVALTREGPYITLALAASLLLVAAVELGSILKQRASEK